LPKEKKEPPSTSAKSNIIDRCPHCGVPLTQWEQVILSVDKVLMCKKCWYRIILDVFDTDKKSDKPKPGEKK
jgi:hypothetical protein